MDPVSVEGGSGSDGSSFCSTCRVGMNCYSLLCNSSVAGAGLQQKANVKINIKAKAQQFT